MKGFIIYVVGLNLVLWGGLIIVDPEILFGFIRHWLNEPVLYTIPVLLYLGFMGLFISFFGFMNAVGKVIKDADKVIRGEE